MSNKVAPARIAGIIAREANVAMIFRRGPRDWSRGYLWNFDTDEVTPGDWIHAKVFTESCDLSPDGRFLLASFYSYGALGELPGKPEEAQEWYGKWTSLSRAPSYAPLGLLIIPERSVAKSRWHTLNDLSAEMFGDWNPMTGDRRLYAGGWKLARPMEASIANVHDEAHRQEMYAMGAPIYDGTPESMRILQDWYFVQMAKHMPLLVQQQPEEIVRTFAGGTLARLRTRDSVRWEARDQSGKVRLDFRPKAHQPQWLDLDHKGRVVYGDQGRLWVWEDFPRRKPRMVADLNGPAPSMSEPFDWATVD